MVHFKSWLTLLLFPTIAVAGICVLCVAANQNGEPKKEGANELKILRAKPLQDAPGDDELKKRVRALYNHRLAALADHYKYIQSGHENTNGLVESGRRLVSVGLEIHQSPKEKIAFLNEILAVLSERTISDVSIRENENERLAKYERDNFIEFKLEVEIEILRIKKAKAGAK